jgi:hypothetical protein
MITHIRGPWTVERTETNCYRIVFYDEFNKRQTLLTTNSRRAGLPSEFYNAQLAAFSPRLLDGLRWIANTVHQAHHTGAIEDCGKNTCTHALDLINQALTEPAEQMIVKPKLLADDSEEQVYE